MRAVRTSSPGEDDMWPKKLQWLFYLIVLLMLSMTVVVGASVQQKSAQHLKKFNTPLVYDDPQQQLEQARQDIDIARLDERVKNLQDSDKAQTEWIKQATQKMADHDVQFGEIKFYGYGMIGLATALNALGITFVWKKK